MKDKIFKIICIINILMAIIVFILVDFVLYKDIAMKYDSTNYLALIIIEVINIIFGILLFRKGKKKLIHILYIAFIIIIIFIPIYHNGYYFAPTGPNSYLMGLAFNDNYLDVYGINLKQATENLMLFNHSVKMQAE